MVFALLHQFSTHTYTLTLENSFDKFSRVLLDYIEKFSIDAFYQTNKLPRELKK